MCIFKLQQCPRLQSRSGPTVVGNEHSYCYIIVCLQIAKKMGHSPVVRIKLQDHVTVLWPALYLTQSDLQTITCLRAPIWTKPLRIQPVHLRRKKKQKRGNRDKGDKKEIKIRREEIKERLEIESRQTKGPVLIFDKKVHIIAACLICCGHKQSTLQDSWWCMPAFWKSESNTNKRQEECD